MKYTVLQRTKLFYTTTQHLKWKHEYIHYCPNTVLLFQVLHLTDEKEHVSPASRENSEETPNHNVSEDSLTASSTNDLPGKRHSVQS